MMCKAMLARQSPTFDHWTQGFTRGILIIVLREERPTIYVGGATVLRKCMPFSAGNRWLERRITLETSGADSLGPHMSSAGDFMQ